MAAYKALVRKDHTFMKVIMASQGAEIPEFDQAERTGRDVMDEAMYGSDPHRESSLVEIMDLVDMGYEFES